jgi:hypothetical protein
MTTVENALGATAIDVRGVKHSLRSNDNSNADAETFFEEAALVKEEEKLMEDEEITSEEDIDDADVDANITVALVKSLVDNHAPVARPTTRLLPAATTTGSDSNRRYGLRKRRRQSGADLERLEHFQSSKDGGLARSRTSSEDVGVGLDDFTMPPPAYAVTSTGKPSSMKKSTVYSRRLNPRVTPASKPSQQGESSDAAHVSLVPNPLTRQFITKPAKVSGGELTGLEPKKVTINNPPVTNRKRGFSIDLDCKYWYYC